MLEKSLTSYDVLVCTYDAKWHNRCMLYPVEVHTIEGSVSAKEPPIVFEPKEGMCAHDLHLTPEYIIFSCSKLFEDGSIRKVRVYSTHDRQPVRGHPDQVALPLVLEQSTPVSRNVQANPLNTLTLIRHSKHETDLIYTVQGTAVVIKLLKRETEIGWRTHIN